MVMAIAAAVPKSDSGGRGDGNRGGAFSVIISTQRCTKKIDPVFLKKSAELMEAKSQRPLTLNRQTMWSLPQGKVFKLDLMTLLLQFFKPFKFWKPIHREPPKNYGQGIGPLSQGLGVAIWPF